MVDGLRMNWVRKIELENSNCIWLLWQYQFKNGEDLGYTREHEYTEIAN